MRLTKALRRVVFVRPALMTSIAAAQRVLRLDQALCRLLNALVGDMVALEDAGRHEVAAVAARAHALELDAAIVADAPPLKWLWGGGLKRRLRLLGDGVEAVLRPAQRARVHVRRAIHDTCEQTHRVSEPVTLLGASQVSLYERVPLACVAHLPPRGSACCSPLCHTPPSPQHP